jgi:hypothetical protein
MAVGSFPVGKPNKLLFKINGNGGDGFVEVATRRPYLGLCVV